MNSIFLPNGMEAWEATYQEMPIEDYRGNPLIETLPSFTKKEVIIQKLMNTPSLRHEEKELNTEIRIPLLRRLYQVFQPLPIHADIWNMIHSLVYEGYLARNPFDSDYKRFVNETGKQIIERTYDIHAQRHFRTTSSAGILIGMSGIGKTTTVNRILQHIPQIIIHNTYQGEHFQQIQLTWMKLEIPYNSSLKALCLQYFMKLDELLGTNNFKKYVSRNLSVDAMIPLIGQVAQNVKLGLLVLDEIQHIKSRGTNQMVDFFVSLINTVGLPILLIGTPASYSLFENEFRLARRLTGNGEIIWNHMENDALFRLFLEGIWRYQWTQKDTPLTAELVQVFFDETQGVSDLVVKLFHHAQTFAITSGKETITIDMIKKAAKEKFRLMKPMIDAIRSGNPYKMAKYEDLRTLDLKEEEKVLPVTLSHVTQKKENSAEKVVKPSEDTHHSPIKKRIPQTDYADNDFRKCIQLSKQNDFRYEQWLTKYGYLDDMTFWMRGESP